MRDAFKELVDEKSNGSKDLVSRLREASPEQDDADNSVDVTSLFEWYDRHVRYYGSMYRYPVARLVSGSPHVFRRNTNGGHSLVDVGQFAFRHWVAAYLTALYTTIFPKEPQEAATPT